MTKRPFIAKGYITKECLELMYIDMHVHAPRGYEYFIMFMSDYSRFKYIYRMHRKFNTFEKFIEFKEKLENQLCEHIKALQSYQSGEYMST